ncbi:MAG: ChbG/HpnK family deacetylase [Acidobacteria bacterium]|nr:ChbG/HpnK family deacetylase [Acidobacteriota bacterium]
MRLLTVNADDFGFTRGVNSGIVEAHLRGILTSTTLMANGTAFDDAVQLARQHPTLDIGVHFVLVQGNALLDGRPLPRTPAELVRTVAMGRLDLMGELRAQMDRIASAGIRVTHADAHKHTHLLPPVLDAVARVCAERGVKWVRRPLDMTLTGASSAVPWKKRLVSRALWLLEGRFESALRRRSLRRTDGFWGFQVTGRYSAEDVIQLIRNLPEGVTEFMVHPGHCDEELRGAATRLRQSRADELRVLTDPRVVDAIREAQVRLTGYGDL